VREFTRTDAADPLLAAANLVTSGRPADPDYHSLWPRGEVRRVTRDEDGLTVELGDDRWRRRPAQMSARAAHQALQQMVYTVQAAAQERLPVVFTVDGRPAEVFGIPTADGIRQDSPLKALNLVSITTPESGARAEGPRVQVSGVANSFEATVVCQVLQDGRVRASSPATAEGWMGDKLFPFEVTLRVPPTLTGVAEVRCATDDPTGGTEGVGIFSDDKQVTLG